MRETAAGPYNGGRHEPRRVSHAGFRLSSVARLLASAVAVARDGRGQLRAPQPLQGWPGVVHGGALVALLDAAATRLGVPDGPRVMEGRLTASVPVETPLGLEGSPGAGAVTFSVLQDGQPLTTGAVRALDVQSAPPPSGWRGGESGWPLPMSEQCVACGALNPLGLQAALRFDEEGVWARLVPRPPWWLGADAAHPALAPVLLDEVAWWLGALVMKEGGLTNRLSVTLASLRVPARHPLIAAGRFRDVSPVDRKRTFWRTATVLMTEEGEPLAAASIVFRGGPDYSARQMAYFRPRTAPDLFARMFPSYAASPPAAPTASS